MSRGKTRRRRTRTRRRPPRAWTISEHGPLVGRLVHAIDPGIFARGAEYCEQDRVSIDYFDRDALGALVEGTDVYDVMLVYHSHGGRLDVACTCPHFLDRLQACEHVWATIIHADRYGYLPDAVGDGPLFLRADGFDEPDSDRPAMESDWRQLLAMVRDAPDGVAPNHPYGWPDGRQLVYVIDPAAARARGSVTLQVACRDRRADGRWGKIKSLRLDMPTVADLSAIDRRLMTIFLGADRLSGSWGYGPVMSSEVELDSDVQLMLFPMLCETGRCLLVRKGDTGDPAVLRWDDGPPWELEIEVCDHGDRFMITGLLRRGEQEALLIDEPAVLTDAGILIAGDRAARFDAGAGFSWARVLRGPEALEVPAAGANELLDALLAARRRPARVVLPESLQCPRVDATPRPGLQIKQPRWSSAASPPMLHGRLSFDYDGMVIAPDDDRPAVLDLAARRLIGRDQAAERAAADRLRAAGFGDPPDHHGLTGTVFEIDARCLAGAVRDLLSAGWRVEAEGRAYRTPSALTARVATGIDWFELHGAAEFEGGESVSLPELLEASRDGTGFVQLGDGSMGVLPGHWTRLAELGAAENGHVRFARNQAGLLDVLLEQVPQVETDRAFARARRKLAQFRGIRPAAVPRGFKGTLRPYQREGLAWFRFLEDFGFGGCLADDMGLGKTVQVLALLEARRAQDRKARRGANGNGAGAARRLPSLVVVPRSLVVNWIREASRFSPRLAIVAHHGPARARSPEAFDECDVVVTTYGTLRRDAAWLSARRFDYLILDEAQAIKNPQTETAKAARVLQADHRLALSGTPVENHLGELWSLFEFLNPGMLGSQSGWTRWMTGDVRDPDDRTRQLLGRALRPFVLRRTKEQVAPDLPEKLEQTVYCDLLPRDRRRYDELLRHYRGSLLGRIDSDGIAKAKMHVLEALLRLRQAACHPGLVDQARRAEPSAKLELLLEQLADVVNQGHKALIFSQFTKFLAVVRDRLDAAGITYEYLDGRTRKRGERVERFQQDPACSAFLISLKAGGLGLNLTAAEYVFLLDPWWNPAVEAQAIDRTHRIGQTSRVFAYRIIARDTVEERVLELQARKKGLADAIVGPDNSVIRSLTREDLELLLS